MEWISERNPNSPGMYAIRNGKLDYYSSSLSFAYFDGMGWILPSQVGSDIFPYRSNPIWSVVNWGKDEITQ